MVIFDEALTLNSRITCERIISLYPPDKGQVNPTTFYGRASIKSWRFAGFCQIRSRSQISNLHDSDVHVDLRFKIGFRRSLPGKIIGVYIIRPQPILLSYNNLLYKRSGNGNEFSSISTLDIASEFIPD
ncbi:hypothetical protein NPIL_405351 [Nephila pilipes]|uniref:Uncharacterized protein n=1 Tax=Nephila pilipes TaxID=299642 RepID=A0A8X6UQ37_NEPPI|nr:hypothetical protein NPIL_405351 [Nephila pilipes]